MWIFAQIGSYLRTALLAMATATLLFLLHGSIRTSESPIKTFWLLALVLVSLLVLGAQGWAHWKLEKRYSEALQKRWEDELKRREDELNRLEELIREIQQADTELLERRRVVVILQSVIRDLEPLEAADSIRPWRKPEKVGSGV